MVISLIFGYDSPTTSAGVLRVGEDSDFDERVVTQSEIAGNNGSRRRICTSALATEERRTRIPSSSTEGDFGAADFDGIACGEGGNDSSSEDVAVDEESSTDTAVVALVEV